MNTDDAAVAVVYCCGRVMHRCHVFCVLPCEAHGADAVVVWLLLLHRYVAATAAAVVAACTSW